MSSPSPNKIPASEALEVNVWIKQTSFLSTTSGELDKGVTFASLYLICNLLSFSILVSPIPTLPELSIITASLKVPSFLTPNLKSDVLFAAVEKSSIAVDFI